MRTQEQLHVIGAMGRHVRDVLAARDPHDERCIWHRERVQFGRDLFCEGKCGHRSQSAQLSRTIDDLLALRSLQCGELMHPIIAQINLGDACHRRGLPREHLVDGRAVPTTKRAEIMTPLLDPCLARWIGFDIGCIRCQFDCGVRRQTAHLRETLESRSELRVDFNGPFERGHGLPEDGGNVAIRCIAILAHECIVRR